MTAVLCDVCDGLGLWKRGALHRIQTRFLRIMPLIEIGIPIHMYPRSSQADRGAGIKKQSEREETTRSRDIHWHCSGICPYFTRSDDILAARVHTASADASSRRKSHWKNRSLVSWRTRRTRLPYSPLRRDRSPSPILQSPGTHALRAWRIVLPDVRLVNRRAAT